LSAEIKAKAHRVRLQLAGFSALIMQASAVLASIHAHDLDRAFFGLDALAMHFATGGRA
jgi:hypothetical protein